MTANQRHYYRILDTVALEYREVPAAVVPTTMASTTATGKRPEDFFEMTAGFHLLTALNAVDQEHAAFLRSLHERDRELAGYLRGVNRKIELIAHAFALNGQDLGKLPRYEVSLSEGGIAFDAPQVLGNGQLLALKLTLLPRLVTIICFARVVSGTETEGQRPFSMSLEFIDLDEPQRQLLARHILRLQSAQQRNR